LEEVVMMATETIRKEGVPDDDFKLFDDKRSKVKKMIRGIQGGIK
jgi:hypothetical protein